MLYAKNVVMNLRQYLQNTVNFVQVSVFIKHGVENILVKTIPSGRVASKKLFVNIAGGNLKHIRRQEDFVQRNVGMHGYPKTWWAKIILAGTGLR